MFRVKRTASEICRGSVERSISSKYVPMFEELRQKEAAWSLDMLQLMATYGAFRPAVWTSLATGLLSSSVTKMHRRGRLGRDCAVPPSLIKIPTSCVQKMH